MSEFCFNFNDKLWNPRKPSKARKVTFVTLGILCLLLDLFGLLMDGLDDGGYWLYWLAVPVLLFWFGLRKPNRGKYITAPCKLCISPNSVRVVYQELNRRGKMGWHTVIQSIRTADITDVQLANTLIDWNTHSAIWIFGQVDSVSVSIDGTLQKDKESEIFLSPPDKDMTEQIMAALKFARSPHLKTARELVIKEGKIHEQ